MNKATIALMETLRQKIKINILSLYLILIHLTAFPGK